MCGYDAGPPATVRHPLISKIRPLQTEVFNLIKPSHRVACAPACVRPCHGTLRSLVPDPLAPSCPTTPDRIIPPTVYATR